MSHQFSILQLFAGYNSLQCNLLSISRQNYQLKSLLAGLRVEYCRRIGIMLQTDMSNLQTQICQRLRFFRQMCFCYYTWTYVCLSDQLCHLPIGRLGDFKNQYIQWLKKLPLQLSSHEVESYISNTHIAISLCKDLSKLGILNKQLNGLSCISFSNLSVA